MASESVQEPAVAEIQEAMAAAAAVTAAATPDPTRQALDALQVQVDGLTLEVGRLKQQVRQLQPN